MIDHTVRIVLCMIVRNEATVIGRCLDSALPHVDGYLISDTGSADNTIDLIQQTAARHGVAGHIRRDDFYNFGHNRTLAAEMAREWAAAQGWPGASTYLLFLDADMILHVEPGFDRSALTATSYVLAQDDGTLRYWNVRLARLSQSWQAVGVTHEYWQAVGDQSQSERLDTMWIEDRSDGGSKADKFERDIRLLTQALAQQPNNPRYTLYLAQSYFDVGRYTDAERLYARRWALGGWEEERWLARYRQGWTLLRLGDRYKAAGILLDAFDARPTRAEPLWLLARHYRDHHQHHAALMTALRALEIPYPHDDMLFVERQVYEWMLWEEVMISAYYAGARYHDVGFSACERLRARRGHPPWFYAYVARNEAFYVQPARGAGGPIALNGAGPGGFHPVAVRYGDSTIVNVTLPGSELSETRYPTIDPDGAFTARYVTLTWDGADAAAAHRAGRRFDMPRLSSSDTAGRGLEDVRWTVHDGRVWFTAAYYPAAAGGASRIALGRMNETLDGVEHLVVLEGEHARLADRNWMPWSQGGDLAVIAGHDPFVVLRVDPRSGATEIVHTSTPPFRAADFRGATPPVPAADRDGRFVALVNEVTRRDAGDL